MPSRTTRRTSGGVELSLSARVLSERASNRYGRFKRALEALPGVGAVRVTYGAYDAFAAAPCLASKYGETSIEFLADFGDLPAMKVTSLDLAHSSSDDFGVAMLTRQRLRCPRGSCVAEGGLGPRNCTGGFYLGYDDEYTSKLGWNATTHDVQRALQRLETLKSGSDFGKLAVNVTGGPTVCGYTPEYGDYAPEIDSTRGRNVTIEFRGTYGNVYTLALVNSLYRADSPKDATFAYREKVNLTLDAEKGTKEDVFCSDRGWCDFATGELRARKSVGPGRQARGSSERTMPTLQRSHVEERRRRRRLSPVAQARACATS